MNTIDSTTNMILKAYSEPRTQPSLLVAISGIDGCGKGFVSNQLCKNLQGKGLNTTVINIDGWLNLPSKRFSDTNPAEHFYLDAIRFEELFSELVFPLREQGRIKLAADYAEETAKEYRKHLYEYENIQVILLEGIYLLKKDFQAYYDMSFWVECSFETAMERALYRAQEGLSQEQTIQAYNTIYFPAQELHFKLDNPRAAATALINNDPRLESTI